MARLSDLVNTKINSSVIKIQDKTIPVIFTMKSFPLVEEAYGKPYHVFEKELNGMLKTGEIHLGKKEIRLMNCLIYAMVRSGGTDCTFSEIENSIPLYDLPDIFKTILGIFSNQNFQEADAKKIKSKKK